MADNSERVGNDKIMKSLQSIDNRLIQLHELVDKSKCSVSRVDLVQVHNGLEKINRLSKSHSDLNEVTEKLVSSQNILAETLKNINDNLQNGFKLGADVVKLFGKIVLIFLFSLVVLSVVIVWIAKIDVSNSMGKYNLSIQQHDFSEAK